MKRTINMVAVLFLVISTTFIAGCGDDSTPFFFFPGALTVTTASLPGATVGTAYSQTLAATGGTTPYTWSISAGALPAGVSLNAATGVISGTPTTAGTANFTVMVTDSATPAGTDTQALSIVVAAPGALTVTTASLPGATVNTAYSQTLTAAGGTAPYTWSISVGTLPAGLLLNAATGVISGTPTTAGTANFTVMVTDSATPAGTDTQALSIVVAASGTAVTVTTASLPGATVGTAYSQTLAATGGTTPYTWSISLGALPAGLLLNAATGVISGTPTTAGNAVFTVMVTDSATPAGTDTQALSIAVAASGTPVTVTTASPLPPATFGTAYSQTLAATGGTAPYTWSISAGALPSGLSLTAASGVISGIPLVSGPFSFTVTATDSATNTAPKSLSLTIDISASVASGQTNYNTYCAGCHSLGVYDTSGSPDLSGVPLSAFNTKFGGGADHNGRTLTAIEINNMFAFTSLF